MKKNFKIALVQPPVLREWEHGDIPRIAGVLREHSDLNHFEVVDDSAEADLLVLLESCSSKDRHHVRDYLALPGFTGGVRMVGINYEDTPPGFLPGMYSSLERNRFDPAIHLSWPYLEVPNKIVETVQPEPPTNNSFLFSFSGSCSHPLRRIILNHYQAQSKIHSVKEIDRWYNHTAAENEQYIDQILNSRFILCPRGIASYTHRILETLALGRVPVVIADDWVPFSIPEADYYIRIREQDVLKITDILQEKSRFYDYYRESARRVYAQYFHRTVRYSTQFNALVAFYQNHLSHLQTSPFKQHWQTNQFWRANGWAWDQRLMKKIHATLTKRPASNPLL